MRETETPHMTTPADLAGVGKTSMLFTIVKAWLNFLPMLLLLLPRLLSSFVPVQLLPALLC